MGKLMNELLRRVPRDEWRQRMQRAMTTLSVYQRENLRLRAELHSGAPPTQADVSDGMLEFQGRSGFPVDNIPPPMRPR